MYSGGSGGGAGANDAVHLQERIRFGAISFEHFAHVGLLSFLCICALFSAKSSLVRLHVLELVTQ